MELDELLEIEFENKTYYADKLKIIYILSKLEKKCLIDYEEKYIIELMKKYSLIDVEFLVNVNKL